MSSTDSLLKDINNKKFLPIYFLAGDEPYFIDKITKALEENVLTEEEKGFNQTIVYGQDTEIGNLIGIAKQFPMGAERSLVMVKEGQHLSRVIDQLTAYVENPQPSTVLVINYKGKTLDKRTKLYKAINASKAYFEFKKLYENEIPLWIEKRVADSKITIDPKAKFLLAEFVGADLSRLDNEIAKLATIVGAGNIITPDQIERNIGFSKDFNNFELRSAIATKDLNKAIKIIKYFEKNPKDNPLVLTITSLFSLFQNIIILHTLADKSKANAARELGVHPFFVEEYFVAARNYPLKSSTRIISHIREYDLKSKGVNSTGNVSQSELLLELVIKMMHT